MLMRSLIDWLRCVDILPTYSSQQGRSIKKITCVDALVITLLLFSHVWMSQKWSFGSETGLGSFHNGSPHVVRGFKASDSLLQCSGIDQHEH